MAIKGCEAQHSSGRTRSAIEVMYKTHGRINSAVRFNDVKRDPTKNASITLPFVRSSNQAHRRCGGGCKRRHPPYATDTIIRAWSSRAAKPRIRRAELVGHRGYVHDP